MKFISASDLDPSSLAKVPIRFSPLQEKRIGTLASEGDLDLNEIVAYRHSFI